MTVFTDLQTVLETTGSKVFANHKLDSVKQAIVYHTVGQRIVGSMAGNGKLNVERVQISCYALREDTLQNMAHTIEQLLAFYDSSQFTAIPAQVKVEGYDDSTSTFFVHEDFFIQYKEI